MNPLLEQFGQSDYHQLPEVIRQYLTEREYMWLSEREKAELVLRETEPDVG